MSFEKNVFINCPFDKDYIFLMRTLTFTLQYLDFSPFVSQTISSSTIRVNQIKEHIRSCKYSIHDLSRSRPMKKGELPRFNMPYELGLDLGACEFGGKILSTKKTLILETRRFHYQQVLSDISGQDIENHDDDPKTMLTKVRNWISSNSTSVIVGQSQIWIALNQFNSDLTTSLSSTYSTKDINEMPIGDYMKFTSDWISKFKV